MHYYLLMARTDPQLNLRLPAELKDMLDEAAVKNKRSVTAETVDRLQTSFGENANFSDSHLFMMARLEMRIADKELDAHVIKLAALNLLFCLKEAMEYVEYIDSGEGDYDRAPDIRKRWADAVERSEKTLNVFNEDISGIHDETTRVVEASQSARAKADSLQLKLK